MNSYNSDFLKAHEIAEPQISLTGKLNENEIWLEGAEVSKSAYPLLYLAYGDMYGTAENDDNFVLPDFRGRVLQGADGFGYLEAGLPDITGYARVPSGSSENSTGCFKVASATIKFQGDGSQPINNYSVKDREYKELLIKNY